MRIDKVVKNDRSMKALTGMSIGEFEPVTPTYSGSNWLSTKINVIYILIINFELPLYYTLLTLPDDKPPL